MTRVGNCPPQRKSTRNNRLARMVTRLRSRTRRLKKVRFQADESESQTMLVTTRSAARSLFSTRYLLELPNELLSIVLTYCNAKELMLMRCVCRKFTDLIDNNHSIWSQVSFQNLWPTTQFDLELFARGIEAKNKECFVKLGLAHLYHYNLNAGSEKNNREVKANASLSATYFLCLDNSIAPKKPLTWMLIRPPWSLAKSICLKQAVHQQLLRYKGSDSDKAVTYNIGRVLKLDQDVQSGEKALENLETAAKMGCKHAIFEKLMYEKHLATNDTGSKLKWFRELIECSSSGNLDASFELCENIISGHAGSLIPPTQALQICRDLFQNCKSTTAEKLDNYQPKINSLMRCILVDWLAEVAYMKDMSHEVLHAAVQYVDRFLMARVIERTKLQLLGITCLLLAAKSHYDPRQVHILTVRESSWLTDQTYQYEDVVKMLGEIIGTFRGDLWCYTSWNYLNLLLTFSIIDSESKHLSHYLHDLSLQFTSVAGYKPSIVAASILLLARIILNKETVWPSELEEHTGFAIKDLANCTAIIYYKCYTCPSIKDDRDLPLKSIKDEYLSEKHACTAKTVIPLQNEIKKRFLSADPTLSCVSQDPLTFVVMSVDIDETLNASVKSVDYDGDCEDYNDPMDSSFDEESFCVGRTRLSSLRSVDEFSDDETTMDVESLNFDNLKYEPSPRDSFTPIFHSISERVAMLDNKQVENDFVSLDNKNVFLFPDKPGCSSSSSSKQPDGGASVKTGKGKESMKRRQNSLSKEVQMLQHNNVVAKRTRYGSNYNN